MRETLPFFDCIVKIPFHLNCGVYGFLILSFSLTVSGNQIESSD